MPIKGDVKKQFRAMREMVKDSSLLSLRLIVEKGLALARQDSIIGNTPSAPTTSFYTINGKKRTYYIERPEMDKYSKDRTTKKGKVIKGKRVFSAKKFVERTGNLMRALTPAGHWSGNRLPMLGDSEITTHSTDKGCKAVLKFGGTAGKALTYPGSRKPFDAFKKTVRVWNSFLKAEVKKRFADLQKRLKAQGLL